MPDATAKIDALLLPVALKRLADALASATSPDDICTAALEGLQTAVGLERATVRLFDDEHAMRCAASRGLPEQSRRAVEGYTPWLPGQSPPPEPLVVPDVTAEPLLRVLAPILAGENIRALTYIPVVTGQHTIGAFVLCWTHVYQPPKNVLDAAMAVAACVGLAIGNSRRGADRYADHPPSSSRVVPDEEARERLAQLAEASQRLHQSLDATTVMAEVLNLAMSAVTADAYAVWRRDEGNVWRAAISHGLDEAFTAVELTASDRFTFTEPIVADDVQATPLLDRRHQAYAEAGIKSLVSVPLQIRGRPGGTIVFYYRDRHTPGALELRIVRALGQLSAAAISSAELYAEQQAVRALAVRSAERAEFLAEASAHLTSLDYEQNLAAVANLIVPRFADWCVLDLLEGGELRQLAIAHVDPGCAEFAREVRRRYPPRRDHAEGPWRVIQTGEPLLHRQIDDEFLQRAARNSEHLGFMRGLGLRSILLVPLRRAETVFGVLTLAWTESERHYDLDDVEFAQELARRGAYAIENARLYRQAQDANRAKDEFLAALSHELRTPLNAILGWASILRARPEGEVERGLDVIYRNAVVQTQLVEDLLDASRIVSGRMSIELRDAPLGPILEAAIETVLPQAAEKAIEVSCEFPASSLLVRGDSGRLQQVFWNILSNAVKFTPRGGRIVVGTDVTDAELAVHIADSGAGIRHEVLPFIFDRFKQADSSTTRRYRGLGLGLTLARQLTEMHGGRITAISAGPGLGSTFTVALPRVEAPPLVPTRAPVAPPRQELDGMRILVVDDDPDSLEMLTSMLRSESATVVGAGSAVEALELLQKERAHLVVSDIAMPDHDGYWLMEQLRRLASEGGPQVPCVALTAFANPTVRERALAAGFRAQLSKPFDPEQLIKTLRDAISSAPAHPERAGSG